MSTNEDEVLIDEICVELRQLCTELEKVRAASEKNCGSNIIEDDLASLDQSSTSSSKLMG